MAAKNGSPIITRVRLARHPNAFLTVDEEEEQYTVKCEVSTMNFIKQRLPHVVVPFVYAHEGPGSQRACDISAPYMLIEGFRGNTLQDMVSDLCSLPAVNPSSYYSKRV